MQMKQVNLRYISIFVGSDKNGSYSQLIAYEKITYSS